MNANKTLLLFLVDGMRPDGLMASHTPIVIKI